MTTTNPPVHVPDTRLPVPGWLKQHLSWMLVALAVLATVAVAGVSLAGDDPVDDPARVERVNDAADANADRGSISAIEHRAALERRTAIADANADRGSINAIEHRAATEDS